MMQRHESNFQRPAIVPNKTSPLASGAAPFAICALAVGALGVLLSGCSEGPAATKQEANAVAQEVSVVELQPAALPVVIELPGRIVPTRIAEVRARVSGIVVNRNFQQGADVAEGDILYEIDPKPFEIELQAAEAALSKATAALNQESHNAKRKQALAPSGTISEAQLDMAIAALDQAEAEVAARKADVARAKLNIEYTRIRAPISGRIGRALVTEGALVAQAEHTHVATIQRLNPVYVDFTQSSAELSRLRRDLESGALERGSAHARLILDDGEVYPYEGRLLFSDTTVDPGTGQVTLRAEFANSKMTLLPGMYVRVQIEQGVDPDALAVPQQAVRRNENGDSKLFVVRDGNRAGDVAVRLGRAIGDRWLVLDGVSAGDRVIVDGFQKFGPGDTVAPKPWRESGSANAQSQPSATTEQASAKR